MKKTPSIALACILSLSLVACGNSSTTAAATGEKIEEPLSLVGNWAEEDQSGTYHAAYISEDTIEVYWIMDDGEMQALYWSGTYVAPDSADDSYTWNSVNDKSRTDTALFASSDDTKTFSYKNGELSYEVSAMGATGTMVLVPTDTDYSTLAGPGRGNASAEYEDLRLITSGYAIVQGRNYNYVYYAVEINNPNADIAIEFPTIELTAKNDTGAILGTETQVLMAIAAGDTYKYGGYFLIEGDLPTQVEISLASTADYNYVTQKNSGIVSSSDFVISNVSELGTSDKRYTGEVTNNSTEDLNMVCMCVIYIKDGKIVGGNSSFIDDLGSGKTKAFEIKPYGSMSDYDSYEIVALQW